MALAEISGGRLEVVRLDLSTDLRALLHLRVPVPTQPGGDGEIVVEPLAVLGLTWPEPVLSVQLPGTAFVEVLAPDAVFHANVLSGPVQPLCLGVKMPRGIPATELVIASFRALSLQEFQNDTRHPAGVLNARAAEFWSHSPERMPLTSEPFLLRDCEEVRP
jgi:hypothetical protein